MSTETTKLVNALPQVITVTRGTGRDYQTLTFYNVKHGHGRDAVALFSVHSDHLFDAEGNYFDLEGID